MGLTPRGIPAYNIDMNNAKALKAAQKTLDREYAKAVKVITNFVVMFGKENKKLATLKVKR